MHALPRLLEENMAAIRALCEQHRVKRLAVFGSAVKGTFDEERSDVDLVVEFAPDARGWDDYFNFKFALEALFGREVDLVEPSAVKNPYFREVLTLTMRELYAA